MMLKGATVYCISRTPADNQAELEAAARTMVKQRSGGIMGNAGQVNYSASTAGLIGFSKSLAREVASHGVRVNAIAPADVASLAAYLASDAAAYINGRQVIPVDGGLLM